MSFLDWSPYHVADRSLEFYLMFISLNIICFISAIIPQGNISQIKNVEFYRKSRVIPIEVYNVIYIACVFIENYYLSRYFFPSAHGIDVHTGRMPFIYFITTASYVVAMGDVIEFLSTHKIRYVAYAVVAIIINVVTKASRIDAFISFVQVGSLLLFYLLSKERKVVAGSTVRRKKKRRLPIIILAAVIIFIVASRSIKVGNDRMNSNGRYNLVYSNGIGYSGPETTTEFLPYYYGYFALSYDNLAYNMQCVDTKNNYIGLNTFRCLYFGVLQFDNILGLDGGESSRANEVRCRAAAVTTVFWDFHYDFGMFAFIPIAITFYIAGMLSNRLKRKQDIYSLLIYFFLVPLWMFGSFDNRIYDYQIIWQVVLIWLLYRKRFVMVTDANKDNVDCSNVAKKKTIRFTLFG
jgi:hypothetical protein